jgi:hypothetical protein
VIVILVIAALALHPDQTGLIILLQGPIANAQVLNGDNKTNPLTFESLILLFEDGGDFLVQFVLVLPMYLLVEGVGGGELDYFVVVDVAAEREHQQRFLQPTVVLLLRQFVGGLERVYVRDHSAF